MCVDALSSTYLLYQLLPVPGAVEVGHDGSFFSAVVGRVGTGLESRSTRFFVIVLLCLHIQLAILLKDLKSAVLPITLLCDIH